MVDLKIILCISLFFPFLRARRWSCFGRPLCGIVYILLNEVGDAACPALSLYNIVVWSGGSDRQKTGCVGMTIMRNGYRNGQD